jgi:hypothetical protein
LDLVAAAVAGAVFVLVLAAPVVVDGAGRVPGAFAFGPPATPV